MKFNRAILPGLLCLAIPFLAMAYMVATNEIRGISFPEYRVEIAGYDPRDMLTGHYIAYRFQWPENTENTCVRDQDCFACFQGAPERPQLRFMPAGDTGSCPAALKLSRPANNISPPQPLSTLLRYNVSEIEAPVLDRMLRERTGKFEVGIIVLPDHRGQVKTLYIDGRPTREFFR